MVENFADEVRKVYRKGIEKFQKPIDEILLFARKEKYGSCVRNRY